MIHRALGLIVLLFLPASLLAIDIDGEVRIGSARGLAKPATVQLLHERQIVYEQFTGLDGRFEFHGVAPNHYVIRAIYESMPEADVAVDLMAGSISYRVPITINPPKTKSEKASVVSVDQLLIPAAARHEYEEGLKDRKVGLCDKAVPHLQKAVQIAPKYGEAYNEIGNCLKTQGNFMEAESAFKKAIEQNATIYPTMNLADLYVAQKKFDQAAQAVEASIAKNPNEGDLLFALARIYFEQGRMKEAETTALAAHSKIHRTADVHLLLAKIYLAAKDFPALVSQLETYLSENPTGPVAAEVRQKLKSIPQ